jgi:CRP-like cAMP-binding protein
MNNDLRLYDSLQQFPLFQGLSRAELLQLVGQTKFGFMKMAAGQTVVKEDETCNQFLFLISGRLALTTTSDDHRYVVEEQLAAPWFLQPEAVFGAHPHYTCGAMTLGESHFITLSKDEVMRLLDDFLIIRLNYLNLLATLAQRRGRFQWRRCSETLRQRIVRFFVDHCLYPAGPKLFRILMTQLAQEVGDSRLDVSNVLNAMQDEGLLRLHRGRIEIPSLERLLM